MREEGDERYQPSHDFTSRGRLPTPNQRSAAIAGHPAETQEMRVAARQAGKSHIRKGPRLRS